MKTSVAFADFAGEWLYDGHMAKTKLQSKHFLFQGKSFGDMFDRVALAVVAPDQFTVTITKPGGDTFAYAGACALQSGQLVCTAKQETVNAIIRKPNTKQPEIFHLSAADERLLLRISDVDHLILHAQRATK